MPKQEELSELKDKIELFKENPVWQHILRYMQQLYMEAAENALGANDLGEVKFAKGIAHAVKLISEFDTTIPVLKAAMGAK